MGCSHTHARELLKSLQRVLKRKLVEEDVGELIQMYRNKKDVKKINNFLN